ncbi:hypothetical protein NKH18_07360 [Streptomyces sp. M10(2022)]
MRDFFVWLGQMSLDFRRLRLEVVAQFFDWLRRPKPARAPEVFVLPGWARRWRTPRCSGSGPHSRPSTGSTPGGMRACPRCWETCWPGSRQAPTRRCWRTPSEEARSSTARSASTPTASRPGR